MKIREILSAGVVALALNAIAFSPAFALRIAPTVVELNGESGKPIIGSMQLVNNEEKQLNLKAMVYEAVPSAGDEAGYANLLTKTANSTLANWIKLNENEMVSLQPGEKKDIKFIVAIPDNAPPGGHYAAIAWSQDPTKPTGSGASIVPQLSVNIALDIAGQAIEKADIVSFTTEANKTNFNKLPIQFEARIANSGNRHFRPEGGVEITNMFGKTVALLPFEAPKAGGNILPQSTRGYEFKWDGDFAFGKYTAQLKATLGGSGLKTANYEVWVMPAGLLVLWLIIALIIIGILVLLIKRALSSANSVKK